MEFELAGLASRFLALGIDVLIQAGLAAALLILASVAFPVVVGEITGSPPAWRTGLSILGVFLIRWGYFVFFETRLRGQTPGKKALGLRVMRESGLPVGVVQALVRNLLRVADAMPLPLCVVGVASVLLSRKGQRLGDLAAGTVVVRERFRGTREPAVDSERIAGWVTRIEEGRSRSAVVLPRGRIDIRQIALIEAYFARESKLKDAQRFQLSWQIAEPLLPLFDHRAEDWKGLPDRSLRCEALMTDVLEMAGPGAAEEHPVENDAPGDVSTRAKLWEEFPARAETLLKKGVRGLSRLSPDELAVLLADCRQITSDLARAQSMGADQQTVRKLNRMAIGGHMLVYGHLKAPRRFGKRDWLTAFPRTLRANAWALLLAALLLFCPAVISAFAVRADPAAAYDLAGPEFFDFTPASGESLHRVPQLMRPVMASTIVSNNLQVAILCFAFGLSAGVGTAWLLVMNGIQLGAVIGWLGANGNPRAVWGWILPHGGTEILAILIAGAAGLLLARAILAPGPLRRSAALKAMARKALVLELGCMAMLAVAALIEGFVSPSSIGFAPRMLIAAVMIALWIAFFLGAGARRPRAGAV